MARFQFPPLHTKVDMAAGPWPRWFVEVGQWLSAPRLPAEAPATSTSGGIPGEVRFDSDYLYICVSKDTWKRAQILTW